jgi:hypothetical protein
MKFQKDMKIKRKICNSLVKLEIILLPVSETLGTDQVARGRCQVDFTFSNFCINNFCFC